MPDDPDGRAERASWLHLCLTPGIGPTTCARLLAAFGLPEDILDTSHARLGAVIGPALARALLDPDPRREAAIAQSLAWTRAADRHLISLTDPRYPPRLLASADPPPLLWVHGQPALLTAPSLAIVGSRAATRAGLQTATDFARHLAGLGLTIVSGLALGIDSAAHHGALGTPAGTVAVLGTGTDRIYPRQQGGLAREITRQGALVSELPPDTEPRRGAFPRRNRLIAGLSLGVLVVEAALHSGSLITARLAADLGREVFAMPGSIHSPTARGCHLLIKQGAQLVESAEDIISGLAWAPPGGDRHAPRPTSSILRPDPADPLLEALGWDPVDAETLLQRLADSPFTDTRADDAQADYPSASAHLHGASPDSAATLLERLVTLELAGRIERLSDGRFKRL